MSANHGWDENSRERLHYSKSMLKRLLRDSLVRDAQIAKPWVVKSHLALKYNIPTSPPEDVIEKNEKIRDGKLAKRKKAPKEEEDTPAKRLKREQGELLLNQSLG
jgi:bromodomain adjacent to zinc finger domain protein 1A